MLRGRKEEKGRQTSKMYEYWHWEKNEKGGGKYVYGNEYRDHSEKQNFLSDIWQSVTEKQIPSLFALSCATVYLTLPKDSKKVTGAECYCQRRPVMWYQSKCSDVCSLWELIQRGTKQNDLKKCKHFELIIHLVKPEVVKKLQLPTTFAKYMMLTERAAHTEHYGCLSSRMSKGELPLNKIKWVHPEAAYTPDRRDCKYYSYEEGQIDKDEAEKCIMGLNSMGCDCMKRHKAVPEFRTFIIPTPVFLQTAVEGKVEQTPYVDFDIETV